MHITCGCLVRNFLRRSTGAGSVGFQDEAPSLNESDGVIVISELNYGRLFDHGCS